MRLGIDFGTTRTVVAACDRGNTPILGFESPDGDSHTHIPTVAATNGQTWRYGWDAVACMNEPDWHAVRSFKRALSGSQASLDRTIHAGPHQTTILVLMSDFLRHVREQLRDSTHPNASDELVEAMIAVPAGASSAQRFATLEAFRAAGFTVLGLLNEPSAAGIEYAHRYRKTFTAARQEVVVYDLGGGTFDASRVRMSAGAHTVVAHAGLGDLGGADVDALLLGLALAELPDLVEVTDALLERVREAKECITPNTRKVLVEIDDDRAVSVKVSALYEACAPLLARSLSALEPLVKSDSDLAGVYVVGGASELPIVARTLRERFGRKVKRSAYASASIAVGLALAADGQAPQLEETLSRAFGVFREADGGERIVFDPILAPEHRTTSAPIVRRYRAAHNIGHLRYVECDTVNDGTPDGDVTPFADVRVAYDATLIGTNLDALEVQGMDQGPVIEEAYSIQKHGAVNVTITNLDSGVVLVQF